jgi:hypothetical protein
MIPLESQRIEGTLGVLVLRSVLHGIKRGRETAFTRVSAISLNQPVLLTLLNSKLPPYQAPFIPSLRYCRRVPPGLQAVTFA